MKTEDHGFEFTLQPESLSDRLVDRAFTRVEIHFASALVGRAFVHVGHAFALVGRAFALLILLAVLSEFYFVEKRILDSFYRPIQLARSGYNAAATVTSCRHWTRHSAKSFNTHWVSCEITYNGHVVDIYASAGGFSFPDRYLVLYHAVPSQRVSVKYLPDNPSVVRVADPGDSAWTMLVRNEGWLNSFFGLLFVVLPIAVLGAVLQNRFRKRRSSVPEASGGSQGQG